jgi:dihydrofolate reductase
MQGGTTFHFVTAGVEAAIAQAKEVAGDRDVVLGGGGAVVQQALRAGFVDDFQVTVAPVLLGGGVRLLDGLDGVRLEQDRVRGSDVVAHLRYRVVR